MDLQFKMNSEQLFKTKIAVESFNKSLMLNGRKIKNTLGKDDFLKLLIVQLENQDPTKPLEDKAFIAQMAQFSSLEQMTEINTTLSNLIINNKINNAYSLLGKWVEVLDKDTNKLIEGNVTEVQFKNGTPNITVNGMSYSVDDIVKVSVNAAKNDDKAE